MAQPKRILFIAEAVTLAHVTRPLVLAQSLNSNFYDVHFACANGFDFVFPKESSITRWPINSISSQQFIKALASGARFYDKKTLSSYIDEDLSLLKKIKPDIVVGDFRLSLSVSAPLCHIPYLALTNAHWSPYAEEKYSLPDHPLTPFLGYRLTHFFFQLIRPFIFKYHALPHNQLRLKHNLEPLGDLRQAYTYGDHTLYLDTPEFIPTTKLPSNHHFIGPLIWSPDIPKPDWFDHLDKRKKNIYVTLGSSGAADKLSTIVSALSSLDVNILVATAGRSTIISEKNIYVAEYLPGIEIIRDSDLVICNGGSATAYQALSVGVPILGIASNMDQYLTMSYVEKSGAGMLIRSEQADENTILKKSSTIISDPRTYKSNAETMEAAFNKLDSSKEFNSIIENIYNE